GSGFLGFSYTLLGKGEEEVHDVERKEDEGRGWVSQGNNGGTVKVVVRGNVE
ncbi:hypothetical protein KI387_029983, partial [Taxus chinensis]